MKKFIKQLYAGLPFKKSFFLFIKKIWSPPQRLYKHLYFKDKFRVDINNGKSFIMMHYGYEIENELFWKGIQNGWEKVSLGLWISLCENSETILDIGANTGVYSLVAKAVNNKAQVFAFEPVERVHKKLIANFSLNGYPIKSYQKAVSNYTGKAVIYDIADEHVLSVTVNKNIHSASTPVTQCEIETITLKEFIETNKIEKIDLIKIDVETHEPEVLEGFGEYLAKWRPSILIEVLNDEVGEKINRLIEGMDYLYFNIDENNEVRQVDNIQHSDYYNYLLCNEEIARHLKLIK